MRKRNAAPGEFSQIWRQILIHDKAVDYLYFAKVMSSLKETRDLLLVSSVKGIINANEFAILYNVNMSKNPLFPYDNYDKFSLDNFSEEECIAEFRVEKNDLTVFADSHGIPPVFRCSLRSVFGGMEGLCVLLKRLAYPCRYSDMIPRFGRPVPEMSKMALVVLDWIFNQPFLSRAPLRTYADAIHRKSAALNNCWGFVAMQTQHGCKSLREKVSDILRTRNNFLKSCNNTKKVETK